MAGRRGRPETGSDPLGFRALRHQLHLTQEHMAALVGVHRVTWARWENGLPSRRHGEPLGLNPFRQPVILEHIRAAVAAEEAANAVDDAPGQTASA